MMIKSRLTFFQVQNRDTLADTPELIDSPFGDGPGVFTAVTMIHSGSIGHDAGFVT